MIVFVILHYLTYEDTRECVSSIKKFVGTNDFHIVIVDNNSTNDSYSILKNKYIDDNKITLIHNDENLGFAKGNNVGFLYAKNNLNPEYIVLCNNDICLMQDDFSKKIIDFFNETHFDVMGPMIVNGDGCKTSNPEDGHVFSMKEIDRLIRIYKRQYFLNKFHISWIQKIIALLSKNKNAPKKVVTEIKKNVILHGSFLVFSKRYINTFDGLEPRTFMYLEEDILYLHLMKNSMSSYYNPQIEIYHKEDSSTNNALNSNRKKNMFVAENTIDSLNIYREILKEYK